MTKGWRKTNWVEVIGSLVASTNQIFIEDVLHVVIKIIKKCQNKVRYNKHKKQQKTVEEKHAYVEGVE